MVLTKPTKAEEAPAPKKKPKKKVKKNLTEAEKAQKASVPQVPKKAPAPKKKPKKKVKKMVTKAEEAQKASAPKSEAVKKPEKENYSVKEIFDKLVANSSEEILPYSAFADTNFIMYAEILRRNKNDCSIPIQLLKREMKTSDPKAFLKNNAEVIAKEIIRCFKDSKGEKVVVVPLSLRNDKPKGGSHANMLLFNTKLMTAEHFEPHGRKDYSPELKGWLQLMGVNLSTSITEINKQLKKLKSDINFKYEAPLDVCPSESMFRNFQGVQALDRSSKDAVDYKGFTIKETGGYCMIWSYFLLELRLKTLSQPASKVYAEYAKYRDIYKSSLQDPNQTIMRLARGYSKIYMDMITRLINEGKFSLEEFIKYRDFNVNKDRTNFRKVSTNILEAGIRILFSILREVKPPSAI